MNLNEILGKEVADLTSEEKSLLRDNVELMNDEQKEKFASVLEDGGSESKLADLLKSIDEVVNKAVDSAMKDFKPADKNIHQEGDVPSTTKEKYAYVKGIMSDTDTSKIENAYDEKEKKELYQKARVGYFFKHLIQFAVTKDPEHLAHVKALAEGVDADGGYLTPPEFRAQLIEDLKDKPVLKNLVTVIPMSSDSLELPTLTSSVRVSWGSENTTISTTTASFGTLTFTPYRLNSLIYTSRELVADSAIAVIPLLTRLFNQAISIEEDRVIVNGSGSGQPKGILQETLQGIDNANVDANLAQNIKRLPFRLGTAYRSNARWIMNSISLAHVASLRDDNKQFLFKEGIEGLTPHRLAGYPVHEQNDMPLDTLLFGDLKHYFFADREKLSVETTTEGAGTFEKHQVAIKVVERVDGETAQPLGFRAITNAGID